MMVQKNPSLANDLLGRDPRFIDVLGVLMGLDMQGFARPEGSDEMPPGFNASTSPSSPPPRSQPAPSTSPPQASSSKTDDDVEMKGEPENEVDVEKKEAEAEKKLGSEAYKKHQLDDAEKHFSRAWEIWPKDITFLTNLGGKRLVMKGQHRF
jgi:hypothetical protein